MPWRNLHLIVGGLTLILFPLQGQYMVHVLGVESLPDGARLMYRSAHIYLLLAGVANICAGYFMSSSVREGLLLRLCEIVLLIAPALLLFSFLTESTAADLDRPIAAATLYLLFGSAVLLLLHESYLRITGKSRD